MNALRTIGAGVTSLLATGTALAQNGSMMDGGMWGTRWMGGHGGYWGYGVPILVLALAVGVVIWVLRPRKPKK